MDPTVKKLIETSRYFGDRICNFCNKWGVMKKIVTFFAVWNIMCFGMFAAMECFVCGSFSDVGRFVLGIFCVGTFGYSTLCDVGHFFCVDR
jgi:hypothetical protein